MGTIREYTKRDGRTTYHAEVRIKGHRPERASFNTREAAQEWMCEKESELRSDAVPAAIRHDWSLDELRNLYSLPFHKLVEQAHATLKAYHDPNQVQRCQLLSIKTGGCSEDCKYCAQSACYPTKIKPTPLMSVEEVVAIAKKAQADGVTRMCLGAGWREIRDSRQFDRVLEMVRAITDMGLEVCCTMGMLNEKQLERFKEAGLYAYNHNLDSSERHYKKIITTRTYQDRLATLRRVRAADVSVCCGGILGTGETLDDRLELVRTLASFTPHPESVPLNRLTAMEGTPLADAKQVEALELAKLVAVARIAMPKAMVRLSCGRISMTMAEQALCFYAGANSIHVGDKLLTTPNPEMKTDEALFEALGLEGRPASVKPAAPKGPTFLDKRLQKQEESGQLRTLSVRNPELIDFASNDYLGIASSGLLAEEIQTEFNRLVFEEGIRPNVGATGSRLLTGNYPYVEQLERSIAAHHDGEAALLFTSGYNANTGLLSCIASDSDALIIDAQVHASTWDGARLSRAKNYLFSHNDLSSLEMQLKKARSKHKEVFVCVESLYSMLGDLSPLESICDLCERFDAWLIVDEAHATGILGPQGRGAAALLPDSSRIIARIHTFGKAIGCHGAAIIGSNKLRDYLINQCRTFIYTTAFPLHTLVALQCTYQRLPEFDKQREDLDSLIAYFGRQADISPLPLHTTSTAVQSIPVGDAHEVVALSERLQAEGLDIRAIRSPTVRKGRECIRICLHAFNTQAEIDQLITALANEEETLRCG